MPRSGSLRGAQPRGHHLQSTLSLMALSVMGGESAGVRGQGRAKTHSVTCVCDPSAVHHGGEIWAPRRRVSPTHGEAAGASGDRQAERQKPTAGDLQSATDQEETPARPVVDQLGLLGGGGPLTGPTSSATESPRTGRSGPTSPRRAASREAGPGASPVRRSVRLGQRTPGVSGVTPWSRGETPPALVGSPSAHVHRVRAKRGRPCPCPRGRRCDPRHSYPTPEICPLCPPTSADSRGPSLRLPL